MYTKIFCMLISFIFLCLVQGSDEVHPKMKGGKKMAITITSTAFIEGGMIPRQYTCDGEDISPPLAWTDVPEGTKSLALICDDPDAPVGTWVHWVLFSMPPSTTRLPPGVPQKEIVDHNMKHGTNDFRRIRYNGPCPPGGTHRYYFRLYALDAEIPSKAGITKAQLLKEMEGHILAEGQLMGRYKR